MAFADMTAHHQSGSRKTTASVAICCLLGIGAAAAAVALVPTDAIDPGLRGLTETRTVASVATGNDCIQAASVPQPGSYAAPPLCRD